MVSEPTWPSLAATPGWSILSHHGLVLFYLASRPEATMRHISLSLGFTERTVFHIIKDLAAAGMVRVGQAGRNKFYSVNREARMLHPSVAHVTLGRLLAVLERPAGPSDSGLESARAGASASS